MITSPPGTKRFKLGLTGLVLGLLLAAVAWGLNRDLISAVSNAPVATVPGTFERELEPGTYVISVMTTTSEKSGPISVQKSTNVLVTFAEVRDSSGRQVPLESAGNEFVQRDDAVFNGFAVFVVDVADTFTFDVETNDDGSVLVTPSILGLGKNAFIGVGLGIMGLVLIVICGVIALLGFLKRRDPKPPAPWTPFSDTALPPPPQIVAVSPGPEPGISSLTGAAATPRNHVSNEYPPPV